MSTEDLLKAAGWGGATALGGMALGKVISPGTYATKPSLPAPGQPYTNEQLLAAIHGRLAIYFACDENLTRCKYGP
jgi:hypothetical protein